MNSRFPYDLDRIRAEGLTVAVGQRRANGSLLRVSALRETASALSDLPTLAQHAEIEIGSLHGAPPIYVPTTCLISNPHVIVAYHESGFPILLGVKQAMKGHVGLFGLTQAGKSSVMALIGYQLARLGYGIAFLGMKAPDPVPIAYLRAGSDSQTRLDGHGNRIPGPFVYFTLQPNAKTRGVNCLIQKHYNLPNWLKAAILRRSLGQDGSEKDAVRRYYATSEQAFLAKVPWGASFRHLRANLDKVKQDPEERRSTSGLRHEIEQLAEIEQANLPENHPANFDIAAMLLNNGTMYFDACYVDVGSLGTACAAFFIQTVVFIKRQVKPSRNDLLFIFIDECQHFLLGLLAQMIEQLAGYGIRLIIGYHNISQLAEFSETVSMTQCRLIFSAVPSSPSDLLIRSLFGTTKEYVHSFNCGESNSTSSGESIGPSGTSISTSLTEGDQFGLSLTEREVPAWAPNDTLDLNNNRDRFIVSVSPGAELSHFGSTPIVCERGGMLLGYDQVQALADDTLNNSPHAILPGAPAARQLGPPQQPEHLRTKRAAWLATLEAKANAIRKELA